MRIHRTVSLPVITLSLLALFIAPCLAVTTDTEGTTVSSQIAVTGITIDPAVLMRGDTGLVTITVKNTGTESVTIKAADFSAKELTTLNYKTYLTSINLGPGDSTDFTFTVRAEAGDDIYYMKFYLDLGTESFRYYVPIKVESTPIDISVLDRPDSYAGALKRPSPW
jgi:hypothetical protein